jgi:hypothetical protein
VGTEATFPVGFQGLANTPSRFTQTVPVPFFVIPPPRYLRSFKSRLRFGCGMRIGSISWDIWLKVFFKKIAYFPVDP